MMDNIPNLRLEVLINYVLTKKKCVYTPVSVTKPSLSSLPSGTSSGPSTSQALTQASFGTSLLQN